MRRSRPPLLLAAVLCALAAIAAPAAQANPIAYKTLFQDPGTSRTPDLSLENHVDRADRRHAARRADRVHVPRLQLPARRRRPDRRARARCRRRRRDRRRGAQPAARAGPGQASSARACRGLRQRRRLQLVHREHGVAEPDAQQVLHVLAPHRRSRPDRRADLEELPRRRASSPTTTTWSRSRVTSRCTAPTSVLPRRHAGPGAIGRLLQGRARATRPEHDLHLAAAPARPRHERHDRRADGRDRLLRGRLALGRGGSASRTWRSAASAR